MTFGSWIARSWDDPPNRWLSAPTIICNWSQWPRSQSLPAALSRRAQIILRMADGEPQTTITHRYGVSRPTVTLWRTRYPKRDIAGLPNELKPGRPRTTSDEKVAELVNPP